MVRRATGTRTSTRASSGRSRLGRRLQYQSAKGDEEESVEPLQCCSAPDAGPLAGVGGHDTLAKQVDEQAGLDEERGQAYDQREYANSRDQQDGCPLAIALQEPGQRGSEQVDERGLFAERGQNQERKTAGLRGCWAADGEQEADDAEELGGDVRPYHDGESVLGGSAQAQRESERSGPCALTGLDDEGERGDDSEVGQEGD